MKEKKTFNIEVKGGLEEGTEFRFKGETDEAPGHDTGDVVIIIREKTHKTFQRVKDSLVMKKKLTLAEALCGFQFSTPFLDGQDLVIRSNPGQVVKPGEIMMIDGKGMPRPHGQRPGNLFVILDVEFPKSLPSESQTKLSDALGGKPLSEVPPLDAKMPRTLTPRQAQELKQVWSQSSRQDNQASCTQQ